MKTKAVTKTVVLQKWSKRVGVGESPIPSMQGEYHFRAADPKGFPLTKALP